VLDQYRKGNKKSVTDGERSDDNLSIDVGWVEERNPTINYMLLLGCAVA